MEIEMTREDILRMAREQGFPETANSGVFIVNTDDLGRILAAERERIAAWVEDMCAGLDANTIANGVRNGGNDDIRAFEVRK